MNTPTTSLAGMDKLMALSVQSLFFVQEVAGAERIEGGRAGKPPTKSG